MMEWQDLHVLWEGNLLIGCDLSLSSENCESLHRSCFGRDRTVLVKHKILRYSCLMVKGSLSIY